MKAIERRLEVLEAAVVPRRRQAIKILTEQDLIDWAESGDPSVELDLSEAPDALLREIYEYLYPGRD